MILLLVLLAGAIFIGIAGAFITAVIVGGLSWWVVSAAAVFSALGMFGLLYYCARGPT